MLKGDLYTITSAERENNAFQIILELNAGHKIFEGHFPGHPVLPGACMLQIVKEAAENVLQKKLHLIKASSLKFLHVINPRESPVLQLSLSMNIAHDGITDLSGTLSHVAAVCFKFSCSFQEW